jgi:Lar family restriction alleviation protein
MIDTCPFCGGVAECQEQPHTMRPRMLCLSCGAVGPAADRPAIAIERWNRRVGMSAADRDRDYERGHGDALAAVRSALGLGPKP